MTTPIPAPPDLPDPQPDDPMELDRPDDEGDIDAALHLASVRRRFAGAQVEPVRFLHWEIERRLGKGGMGAVYLARHVPLDRRVALKVLGPFTGTERDDMRQRMHREAQALARIDHPNVVTVHDVDLDHGRPVIEMELVDGITLRAWQAQTDDWREILSVYLEVGKGLAAIHAAGLVHRDIKPDNLLRRADGRVKIVDLGLAIGPRPAAPGPWPQAKDSLLSATITRPGAVAGTPAYMAPECFESASFAAAADQFAFAVSLYEALHGVLPFKVTLDIDGYVDTVRKGRLNAPPSPPRLPGWLTGVLRQALCYAPDERHPSMSALVDRLERGLHRRRRWWMGSSAVVMSLGLTGLGWGLAAPPPDPCAELESLLHPAAEPLGSLRDRVHRQARPHLNRALGLFTQTYAERQARWADLRLAQCEARTHRATPPADFAVRDACLAHIRSRLDAVAKGPPLDEPDLAGWLVDATKQLERMPRCTEDPESLAGWVSEATEEGAVGQEHLTRAHALEQAGDYDSAEAEARSAVAATEGVHPWLHAEALYRLGHILGSDERGQDAFATLTEARDAAMGTHHDALLCEVIAYRAKLTANVEVDPGTSADDMGLAEACLERTHARSILLRADMLEARGLLALAMGEPEPAAHWHQQALELRHAHLGRSSYEVSKSLHNLANALDEAGQLEPAQEAMLEALQIRQAVLGPTHPKVADVHADLGELLRLRGEAEGAREHLERAREIYVRVRGTDAPHRATVHISLALLDTADGQLDAAEQHLTQARAAQRANGNLGPSHPDQIALHDAEGSLAVGRHDFERALAAFAHSTELLRRRDPDAPEVLDGTLKELQMLFALGRHAPLADRVAREAEPLVVHVAGLDPEQRGRFGWYIGQSSLTAQRLPQARAYLRLALDAYRSLGDHGSIDELSALLLQATEASETSETPDPSTNHPP